ncbi:hypothetical protein Tsubulata_003232 [Turnera subulata]|uniref:Zinc knuckle CX2CX4HX4C domain-containing protein n=1 Tax=Turnera subulata TaxID=218843 RepID=A0A9Q0JS66_9ROSI|nr:hypothetical protein Tsubulata_003232 [Turnera subulata]
MASSSSCRVIDLGGENNELRPVSPEESLGVNVARTYVVGKINGRQEEGVERLTMAGYQYALLLQRLVFRYDSEPSWQGFIRARIEVLTDMPLLPGVACLDPIGKEIRVHFQYERLRDICYRCGRITHPTSRCPRPSRLGKGSERPAEDNYGPWMRAKELLGKHYLAKKQVPLDVHDEQMEKDKTQDLNGENNADTIFSLPDGTRLGSVRKKRKVLEEVLLSPIKENARRAHTGMTNMVVELITDLHDASPIHASASKPSWKKMARTTKVKYQSSTLELVQAFDMVAEGRGLELDGGKQNPSGIAVPLARE